MKQKEKELFMALCNMNSEVLDDNIIDSASPEVLGHLFFNRMQGIAYYVLKNCNCLSSRIYCFFYRRLCQSKNRG